MEQTKIKIDEKKENQIPAPNYSDEEIKYRGKLLTDMATARNQREDRHDEFDGMTYTQYCCSNRKGANAFIEPKKNKEDSQFVTGTTRQKIQALLSILNNINLSYEVKAFNDRAIEIVEMGNALEEIIAKTNELDNDEEKKLLRQSTLLEQGTVFVEEIWKENWVLEKDETIPFDGTNLSSSKWQPNYVKISDGPTRNILLNENVFLGDQTIFDIQEQPFIFTIEQMPYERAKSIYGDWERWKNVNKDVTYFDLSPTTSVYNNNLCLSELKKDHCEIVKYQNKYKNEYAIIINGTLMTPVGLPLPRKWGRGVEYNITKQTLGSKTHWAYGVSIPQILKTKQYLLDEMMRLAILKTQKSFSPTRFNMSGTILSSRAFMPGKILNGIDPDKIKTDSESQGMTKSELSMIEQLQMSMEDDTPSQGLSGKNPIGVSRMTATQSQQMKQQAEIMTTLVIFAASMLELKAGNLRMWNVLENWFDPIGQKVMDVMDINGVRQVLENKYRVVNVEKNIAGEGPGQSIVQVTDSEQMKDPMQVYRQEENIKKMTGKPTRIKYINAEAVKSGRFMFYGTVTQKQKKNSDLEKVLFSEMVTGAKNFFPNVNDDYLSERYAVVWGESPTKMFKKMSEMPAVGPDGMPIDPATPPGVSGAGARGSIFPTSMKKAGKPSRPSINTMKK
jgi:hypothetical protein